MPRKVLKDKQGSSPKEKCSQNQQQRNVPKKRRSSSLDEQQQAQDALTKRKKKVRQGQLQIQKLEESQINEWKSRSSDSQQSSESSSSDDSSSESDFTPPKKSKKKTNLKQSKDSKSQKSVSNNKAKQKVSLPKENQRNNHIQIRQKKPKGYVYKPPKPKPVEKQQSINEIMRQYSKISRKKKRKSNFYLSKTDSRKWGEPVGRGAKKLKQKMEQQNKIKKQRQKQRKKQQKKARQLRALQKKQLQSHQNIKKQQIISIDEDEEVKLQKNQKIQFVEQQQHAKTKLDFNINRLLLQKIIDLYTVNAFDSTAFLKEFPHLTLPQIKFNLKVLFFRCFDKIQILFIQKCKQKINLLGQQQKNILVNQLYRKKCFNNLISLTDTEFNQYFNKILYSIFNQEILFQQKEVKTLWKKISEFVRNNNTEIEQVKKQAIFDIDSNQEVKIENEVVLEGKIQQGANFSPQTQQDEANRVHQSKNIGQQ